MKFHCERCKTRYSIADERVRGKILKVRCKNCSAVITVRESGQAVVPRVPAEAKNKPGKSAGAAASAGQGGGPSRSALAGAFQQAMRRGMDSQRDAGESVSDAPADLDAEWFVSADGEQFGPFPLAVAKDWVTSQPMDEELYCWSEGFDDWLPIEKISHFRGLRQAEQEGVRDTYQDERTVVDAPPENFQPAAASSLPPPKREDTPVPLFAATMAQVAAEAPTETEKDNPLGIPRVAPRPARANTPPPLPAPAPPMPAAAQSPSRLFDARPDSEKDAGDSLDLDIGEASRVVKLSMLAGAPGSAGPSAGGLPGVGGGIGHGSGSHPNLGGTADLPVVQAAVSSVADPGSPQLMPVKRRSLLVPLIIAGVVLVGIVAVLLVVTLAGDDGEGDGVARGRVAGQGLAYQYGEPGSGKDGDGDEQVAGTSNGEGNSSAGGKAGATRRVIRKNPTGGKTSGDTTSTAAVDTGDEVDLSGAGSRGVGELGPDDLFDVYQQYKVGIKMCYQSALKRDPLLRVQRADVFIRVNTQGTVTSASVPALAGTPLGQCLERRIKVWRFPKNSSGLNSKFPIMFDT